MKKVSIILLSLLLQIFVLTACASKTENSTPSTDKLPSAAEEPSVPTQAETNEGPAEPETESNQEELSEQEEVSQSEEIVKDTEKEQSPLYNPYPEKEWDVSNELSQEEIDFFTDFMNNIENNGFLASEYMTATNVDLAQVFYNGAGVSAHILTAEEEAAYEEKVRWGIETDVERLTTDEIDRFLQRKTGYSYAEMSEPLKWTYLEQYDVYVSDHGDTNWLEFRCLGGEIQGDIYEVYYQTVYHEDDDHGGILTLKKNGNDYLIVSNQRK